MLLDGLVACVTGGAQGIGLAIARRQTHWLTTARYAWTFGCALLITHIYCAFRYYHGWSHTMAYLETARRTKEVMNLNWGGGLFVNYLFALAWLVDVLWWWTARETYETRPCWLTTICHAFFIFMVFNATVVFGLGPIRWLGITICAGLGVLWWITRQCRS